MCVAVPGKIVEISGDDVLGNICEANIKLVSAADSCRLRH